MRGRRVIQSIVLIQDSNYLQQGEYVMNPRHTTENSSWLQPPLAYKG